MRGRQPFSVLDKDPGTLRVLVSRQPGFRHSPRAPTRQLALRAALLFRLLTARFSSFTKSNHLVSARHHFPSWTRQAFLSSINGAICDLPGFSSSIESAICDAPGFSSSIKNAVLRRAAAPYSSSTTDYETCRVLSVHQHRHFLPVTTPLSALDNDHWIVGRVVVHGML